MAGPAKKKQKRGEHANGSMPQKKFYRQRAHANPFSDHDLTYPESPAAMDWSPYYPKYVLETTTTPEDDTNVIASKPLSPPAMRSQIEIADIGCGYGGLLFALAPKFPNTLILGLEIRTSVTTYVQEKIAAMRSAAASSIPKPNIISIPTSTSTSNSPSALAATPDQPPCTYNNIACLRANTMKFLPNFLPPQRLLKLFLCFPDPHFKTRKHKQRIVSPGLCSEYAYILRPGGKVYTITDVEDLHLWMVGHFELHAGFERVGEEEVEGDECVGVMRAETEEGKKVERNGGEKFVAVFRRVEDPPWP